MSKQTSIEWLIDQMLKQGYFDGNKPLSITNLDHLQHEAKQMHKEEIIITFNSGRFRCSNEDAEDFYNETYGGEK